MVRSVWAIRAKIRTVARRELLPRVVGIVADYASRNIAPHLTACLREPTRYWKHKPNFDVQVSSEGSNVIVRASTDSDIYVWVDRGTKKHLITPNPALRKGRKKKYGKKKARKRRGKRVLRLRFLEMYNASTAPWRLRSDRPFHYGDPRYPKWSKVGIRPRYFSDLSVTEVKEQAKSELPKFLRSSLQRAGMTVVDVRWG